MKIKELMLTEQINEEAIKKWFAYMSIVNYEIHPDGSVSINESVTQDAQDNLITFDGKDIPFTHIRAINGDAEFQFTGGATKNIHKFINAIQGEAIFYITEDCPILSIPRIKGLTNIQIIVLDEGLNEIELDGDIGSMLMDIARGEGDLFELQEELIEGGLPGMARQ